MMMKYWTMRSRPRRRRFAVSESSDADHSALSTSEILRLVYGNYDVAVLDKKKKSDEEVDDDKEEQSKSTEPTTANLSRFSAMPFLCLFVFVVALVARIASGCMM
jgi:hypothetical protein